MLCPIPRFVPSMSSRENYLLSTIELAKLEYQSSQDKNLYGLYVGAESAIKAANETLKAEGKDRKVEIFGKYEAKE